jgi:hypothetical protein
MHDDRASLGCRRSELVDNPYCCTAAGKLAGGYQACGPRADDHDVGRMRLLGEAVMARP